MLGSPFDLYYVGLVIQFTPLLDMFFIASTHWGEYFRDYFNAEVPRLLYLSRYQHIFQFMNSFCFYCLFICLDWISFVTGTSHNLDVFPNELHCTDGIFFSLCTQLMSASLSGDSAYNYRAYFADANCGLPLHRSVISICHNLTLM